MNPLTDQGWKGSDNLHADVELAEGVLRNTSNLDFSASGKVRSRHGYVQKQAGAASSGFAFGKGLVYKQAGTVTAYDIEKNTAMTLFAAQGIQLGHAIVGDTLYVSDGVSKWAVTAEYIVSPWFMPSADDPTFDMRFLVPFPAASKLCYFNGRMYGAIGNVVVYSEPYAFGVYNPARNFFTVSSKVTVLYANQDALFVGADVFYAVTDIGAASMEIKNIMGIAIPDVDPVYDDETGMAYFPTTRGLMVVPAQGADVSLLGGNMFATRPIATACAGILKHEGVTLVVAVAVPDTTYMPEHPLISTDYLRSEAIRKELQNAA